MTPPCGLAGCGMRYRHQHYVGTYAILDTTPRPSDRVTEFHAPAEEERERTAVLTELARAGRREEFVAMAGCWGMPGDVMWTGVRQRLGLEP